MPQELIIAGRDGIQQEKESKHAVEEQAMAVKLNKGALQHAEKLVREGNAVIDQRDDWSEHQPSTKEENQFIRLHGFTEYGKWHLGIDDAEGAETKARYKFPYGDFKNVHRCAILSAESRAGQYKHFDIERACAHPHGMIDASKKTKAA